MEVESERRTWNRFDRRQKIGRIAFGLLATAVAVGSWVYLSMDLQYVASAPAEMMDLIGRMFPPNIGYTSEIVGPLVETVHIAVVGTILAVAVSLPVAFMAAENTSPNRFTYYLGKLIVTVTRSVHVIIWALIFVVVFGPGAFAGMVAIAVRSIGVVGKLLGEEIEEIDFAQVEAVRASGATGLQTVLYGIAPQILPAFVGVSVYRWDINVRGATILGFVGAGGIGVPLFTAIDSFQWRSVTTILIAILLIVFVSEGVSAYARRKVR